MIKRTLQFILSKLADDDLIEPVNYEEGEYLSQEEINKSNGVLRVANLDTLVATQLNPMAFDANRLRKIDIAVAAGVVSFGYFPVVFIIFIHVIQKVGLL